MKAITIAPLLTVFALVACSNSEPKGAQGPVAEATPTDELAIRAGAPLFEGMGDYHRATSSANPDAQRYFNQGMVLMFGFNHAEAIRSFQAAQRLDDTCAICFWGEALATGPNINVTSNGKAVMSRDERVAAYAALTGAIERKEHASEVERDYIDALAARYSADPDEPREPLDQAYAAAMRELARKYPFDDDAQALFAEAMMVTMPWDYWLDPEQPKPGTVEVIDALETVMERSPRHPLALHLYIHAVEASSQPERAEEAADRLAKLVPGSGHLVHMPAHIYWRVGRYHDASEANVRAAAVDEAYFARCNAQGFYPALYYPHNIHFLWAASSMEGRSAVAIEAARKVAAKVRMEQIQEYPSVELFKTIPLLALVQFGRWDEILAEPEPPSEFDYSKAIWHYARGVAHANLGDLDAAKAEREALAPLRDSVKVHFLDSVDYPASSLLAIADELLLGEIAMAEGNNEAAIEPFSRAVEHQDALPYMEPPFWYYPTRQSLGLALLAANRPAEAEAVYRRDLEQYPRNGWSMIGLMQSLEAQGRADEARELRETFEQVWAEADVDLSASRIRGVGVKSAD
ncbi:Tetratricopeptide repeat protein [Enhygromyxa salina]|uniref:Tetratricopeptide repeat protein n=2 Tax=Enhygromyxa salina TaxID=215803 RepID=A0A2S9YHU5_9BACT|nr:Tetratricopeptide repeat protein [Enhygromyxa salina]